MSDERKKKLKRFLKLSGIIIIVLTLIPYLLDRFFADELYAIWEGHMKRESPMKVSEWFGFLGSYLGAVGTIVIGIVAYMQTDIINKQSQHLSKLQGQVGELQHERRKITKEIEN